MTKRKNKYINTVSTKSVPVNNFFCLHCIKLVYIYIYIYIYISRLRNISISGILVSRTSRFLKLNFPDTSYHSPLLTTRYLELSIFWTNFLVPSVFEISRVDCIYTVYIIKTLDMVLKVSQVAFEKCQKCCNYSNFVHRGHLLEVHFFIFSKTIFQDISIVKVSLKFSLFTA